MRNLSSKRILALLLAGFLIFDEPAVGNVLAQETDSGEGNEAEEGIILDYEGNITVAYGETANLRVWAESSLGKTLTYQWSCYNEEEGNWVEIEGATESSYTITGDENAAEQYECTVSDGITSKEAYFSLKLDTGLTLYFKKSIDVKYGDTAVFKVEAESLIGNVSYQWSYMNEEGDYIEIEGATEDTYSAVADENLAERYRCVVSDGIANRYAYMKANLNSLTLDCESEVTIEYGMTGVLEVRAENMAEGELTYQWYYLDESGDYAIIEGAADRTYSVKGDENAYKEYMCRVTNGIESREAYIYVSVDSRLAVDYESERDVAIKSGETAVLKVKAESPYGRNITYQWSYWDDEEEDYIVIDGEAGNTYSVRADENMSEEYQCRITDGIQYRYESFYPTIDIGFTLKYSQVILPLDYGETADMKVDVKSTWGDAPVFQWYYCDRKTYEWITIEGATDSVYSVKADENAAGEYKCMVSNGMGSKEELFSLGIDTGLTVDYEKETVVSYGDAAVLEVKAKSPIGLKLTYQWCEIDRDMGELVEIQGATESTYTIPAEDAVTRTYVCIVSDGIKNIEAVIELVIDTFTVEYNGNLTVKYGKTAVMEVKAESIRGKRLTYQWYIYYTDEDDADGGYWDLIDGATKSSYSVRADERMAKEYSCRIADVDGVGVKTVSFYPTIDAGFTISYEGELAVTTGETAVMKVSVENTSGDALAYQWYYRDKETGKYVAIEGATEAAYSVKADADIPLEYRCTVSNGVGSKNAGFSLSVIPKTKIDIGKACTAALSFTSAEYTGAEIKPAVTVSCGTQVLKSGTDYTISYTDNIKVGTAKVTITGKGDYTGTIEKTFTIAAKQEDTKQDPVTKKSIEKAVVTLSKTSCSYNGKQQKPSVKSVKLGSTVLKNGRDYSVSYKNNKNIGKATVTITGKGGYTGTVTKNFTISAKKGTAFTVGSYRYKITGSSAAAFVGLKSSKTTKVTIPKTVKIGGKSFKVTSIADKALKNKKVTSVKIGANVTAIGKEAFQNCKKLGTITIQSTKLKTVGKNAFKGIKTTAKIKVPSKKLTAYKKLLKGKGQSKKVQIKK